ncbi:MAG: GTPase Era [Alphaproteobacteria bacterium]|nr:MAG: GTPase Era [Alphaproteobacteria bacterium]
MKPSSEQDSSPKTRCVFVALIGAPNAGKSTLLNRLVGEKVSIVSRKPQTTRCRVVGIVARQETQIVLVDTPGIFAPRRKLDRAMVAAAWEGMTEADMTLLLVDASRPRPAHAVMPVLEELAKRQRKVILILNKIDRVPPPHLLPLTEQLMATGVVTDVFMISAMTGDGVEDVMTHIAGNAPEGPWHYPADQVTTLPLRLFAAEITREKVFEALHEELPYSAAVETEAWEEFKNGSVRIVQTIFVQRDSQRAIVLGAGGQQLKRIGQAARLELEKILENRVHLSVHVKVKADWAERAEHFRDWGLDPSAKG